MQRRALVLLLVSFATACGSSSPEGFIKAQTRISCRKVRKCDKSVWEEAGYDSVRECTQENLEDSEEAFVDACEDFDSEAARQCLAGMRKVKRTCDDDAASSEQDEACSKVCGNPF